MVYIMGEGVPGHVSISGSIRKLQLLLKRFNVSYEAENEVTRIHLNGSIMEIYPEDSHVIVSISIPLPSENDSLEYLEYFSKGYEAVIKFILQTKRGIKYQLDTSLPANPSLFAILKYDSIDDIIKDLERFFEKKD